MFIAQVLVGPSKLPKQILKLNITLLRIPTRRRQFKLIQLAIYKRGRGFELGATEKQIQVVVRAGLDPRIASPTRWQLGHAASFINPVYIKKPLVRKVKERSNRWVEGSESRLAWI